MDKRIGQGLHTYLWQCEDQGAALRGRPASRSDAGDGPVLIIETGPGLPQLDAYPEGYGFGATGSVNTASLRG